MPLAIGVDIGGTKVAGGVVDDQGRVLDTARRRPTPGTDVAQTQAVIAEVVASWPARHEVAAVGIGAAGWIANDRATVLFSPHLAWRDEPLRDALAERDRGAGAGGERRQRRGLGRVPLRRGPRRPGGGDGHPGHRYRRRPGGRRQRSTAARTGWAASTGT